MTFINRFNPLLLTSAKKIGLQNGAKLNKSQSFIRPLERDLVKFSGPGKKTSGLDPAAVASHKKNVQNFRNDYQKCIEEYYHIDSDSEWERLARVFIDKHAEQIRKLNKDCSKIGWNFYCQGGDYKQLGQIKTNKQLKTEADQAYKDYNNKPQAFSEVKELLDHKDDITKKLMLRQLKALHSRFKDAGKSEALLELEKQVIDMSNYLTSQFYSFRMEVKGSEQSDTDIMSQLENTDNPDEAKTLWRAIFKRGQMKLKETDNPDEDQKWRALIKSQVKVDSKIPTLVEALVALVKLRNNVARQNIDENGKPYENYFEMNLDKDDVDPDLLELLMKKAEELSREPRKAFIKASNQFSQCYYGISEKNAAYPWFGIDSENLNNLLEFQYPSFVGKDPRPFLMKTAKLMGGSEQEALVRTIIDNSKFDLDDEKGRSAIFFDSEIDKGKAQNWLSFKMDEHDSRIFGSVDYDLGEMTAEAMKHLLHECNAHGLDDLETDQRLPYLLRRAHELTGEAQGVLHESLILNPKWLKQVLGLEAEKAEKFAYQAEPFQRALYAGNTRSLMSIIEFEREMYKDPDQNLNVLWWGLQEKYMRIKPPEKEDDLPGFSRISHLFSHPVSIHYYFLGNIIRSQILNSIQQHCEGGFLSEDTGDFLRAFRQTGRAYEWKELLERMTGKPLDTADFESSIYSSTNDFAIPPEVIQAKAEQKRRLNYPERSASVKPKK